MKQFDICLHMIDETKQLHHYLTILHLADEAGSRPCHHHCIANRILISWHLIMGPNYFWKCVDICSTAQMGSMYDNNHNMCDVNEVGLCTAPAYSSDGSGLAVARNSMTTNRVSKQWVSRESVIRKTPKFEEHQRTPKDTGLQDPGHSLCKT